MNSDKERKDKVGAGRPAPAFARIEKVPPLAMLLYVGMVGITVLFAVLVGLYIYTRARDGWADSVHPLPRWFSLSTVVLLVSSYTLAQAPRLYRDDDVRGMARCLGVTLILGSIFTGLQLLGWRELVNQGVFFTGEPSGTYIYMISALHIVHLLGGMLFLLTLLLRALHAARDGVRTLVFIRNPYRRLQLRLLSTYWHFIDGLWVALFMLFLFLF
ncbi:cytochrome c oxidase subunit III [Hymenobacter busanensis]|uniref:Cytochrome c oxidase subunit III n=1 Tax=Hymenobacter busanensis TaxID=2607656 RepID=A0A7L4ZUK6_9BACT|nr:cytochrome c oxidase subunit 3 [Hymenobacter busanensis]KAA9339741.1 cytochrome c oxidase subunit III [Hymenobacter busanensis]QHJ06505.1 cytochrome c oxidase subunit III [Hymenobacter busanensis]